MYIVELFVKLKNDYKEGKISPLKIYEKICAKFGIKNKSIDEAEKENYEKCDHFFVPIDSTGRVLACSKCGMIYKLKKNEVNPFEK